MIKSILNKIDQNNRFEEAKAHCDIPCKIYDPATAQLACLSLIRMIDLINELDHSNQDAAYHNTLARYISEKEKQGQILKEEVRVIWGDYIKAPQLEKFPEIHELVHGIMLAASKAKQGVDKEAGVALLEKVNRFAEIFWATKDVATKKAVCPYPPALEVVYPAL